MMTTYKETESQATALFDKGLYLKINGDYRLVNFNNIFRLTATGNYTTFYFTNTNTNYVSSKTLQIFVRQLPEELFLRPHRSHLVNRQFVIAVGSSSNMYLMLNNNMKIPISRRKYSWVKRSLLNY